MPQFGGWDQRHGGTPDYSVVFSRARANRKEHKSDIKRASFSNDRDLIVPPYQQRDQVGHKVKIFSCSVVFIVEIGCKDRNIEAL